MNFFTSKTFIIIGLLLTCVICIVLSIIGVRATAVGSITIACFALVMSPRLRAQQREKETAEIDASGQTMLFNAYVYEDAKRYIDQGTNVSATDLKGQTALHVQVDMDHADIVNLLLMNHADPNAQDKHLRTPLFFAKSVKVAEYLVKAGADINAKDDEGNSVINFIAHAYGQLDTSERNIKKKRNLDDVVCFLMQQGAEH